MGGVLSKGIDLNDLILSSFEPTPIVVDESAPVHAPSTTPQYALHNVTSQAAFELLEQRHKGENQAAGNPSPHNPNLQPEDDLGADGRHRRPILRGKAVKIK